MSGQPIPVVDLFAGPGGLGEGFASCLTDAQQPAFQVRLSIEMDPDAHTTLELRSFFRQFPPGTAPKDYYERLRGNIKTEKLFALHPVQAKRASAEAWLAELGKVPANELHERIAQAVGCIPQWVLCGGPPCQAYSTVGRSRRGGIDHNDNRVYLYREYLRILAEHEPSVFIMENVKGLLSSRIAGSGLFAQILADLHIPGASVGNKRSAAQYRVLSLVHAPRRFDAEGNPQFDPQEFVIRSERFGVPQSRHRVILLGVREDLWTASVPILNPAPRQVPVSQVLQGLPKLRSGLSRTTDGPEEWRAALQDLANSDLLKTLPNGHYPEVRRAVIDGLAAIRNYRADRGGEFVPCEASIGYRPDWFLDSRIGGVVNHASRPHMASDLHRYLFATAYAKVVGRSPELRDFPVTLLPRHRNVSEVGKELYFDDRFRVQVPDRPSTTITCHMSKDGHYYIHYDPAQCRSLTVREAARVQTFPDNYLFCGTRTAQYRQVGNAVPPLLAQQIAHLVLGILTPANATTPRLRDDPRYQ
ncbi:MAG: DNA cytosine methyltransferase [Bryobacterales bacterium]|nr:DNA cytosine methyltransferase [Bryobacterales bacterium]